MSSKAFHEDMRWSNCADCDKRGLLLGSGVCLRCAWRRLRGRKTGRKPEAEK